jgi:hypothetical protein
LVLEELHGGKARRVALWGLYCTAWHLHRAYYGGEGPQAVRGEIEPLLARDLRERWEFGALQAETLAAEVLRFWEGAGLLDVYRLAGQEWLAFRHLTFQEYGAARALAQAYRDDTDGLWRCLSPYLLRRQWAGVIPLTLAHLPGAQIPTLVERLLTANESDEDWQRPLFLAAAALAEGAEMADAAPWQVVGQVVDRGPGRIVVQVDSVEVVDASHQQVVDALLNLARTRGGWEESQASATNAISAIGRLVRDGYAAAGLLALAQDHSVGMWVQVEAIAALGELGRTGEAAKAWLALAQDHAMYDWVREKAVEVLGRLERVDDLLALARDEAMEAQVREQAAKVLSWLGQASPEVLAGLRALAEEPGTPESVRQAAKRALVAGEVNR